MYYGNDKDYTTELSESYNMNILFRYLSYMRVTAYLLKLNISVKQHNFQKQTSITTY